MNVLVNIVMNEKKLALMNVQTDNYLNKRRLLEINLLLILILQQFDLI